MDVWACCISRRSIVGACVRLFVGSLYSYYSKRKVITVTCIRVTSSPSVAGWLFAKLPKNEDNYSCTNEASWEKKRERRRRKRKRIGLARHIQKSAKAIIHATHYYYYLRVGIHVVCSSRGYSSILGHCYFCVFPRSNWFAMYFSPFLIFVNIRYLSALVVYRQKWSLQ